MAIGKVWNISGSNGGGRGDMSRSLEYIENSEKTSYDNIVGLEITDENGTKLSGDKFNNMLNEIGYISNSVKTLDGAFVGSVNCMPETALDEMMALKEHFNKTDGRLMAHMVMSFPSEEKDTEKIWKAGREFASKICGENYQGVFAMHCNTDNYHIHLLLNTTGFDGHKFHMNRRYVSDVLQPIINECCLNNGLSANKNFGKKFNKDSMSYADWNNQMRHDIDFAIEHSTNLVDFKKELTKLGYVVNVGKHISLRAETHEKGTMAQARRTGKLGEIYTPDAIEKRLNMKEEKLVVKFYDDISKGSDEQLKVYGLTRPRIKKWNEMSWLEKEEIRAEFRKGNNPWKTSKPFSWTEFKAFQKNIKILSDLRSLQKYGCYSVKDIPETLEKIRTLEKEQRDNYKEIQSEMKLTRPMYRIYNRIRDIESRALLYDLYKDDFYKQYSDEYKTLCNELEYGYGHTYKEVYDYIQGQTISLNTVKANQKALSDDAKKCTDILKAYEKTGKTLTNLGVNKATEFSEIKQMFGLTELDVLSDARMLKTAVGGIEARLSGILEGDEAYIDKPEIITMKFKKEDVEVLDGGVHRVKFNDNAYVHIPGNSIKTIADPNWGVGYEVKINPTIPYIVKDGLSSYKNYKGHELIDIHSLGNIKSLDFDDKNDRLYGIKRDAGVTNANNITLSRNLITNTSQNTYTFRVPGTYGKDILTMTVYKEHCVELSNGKILLTFIDMDKKQAVTDSTGTEKEVTADELYSHFNNVNEYIEKNRNVEESEEIGVQRNINKPIKL